MAGGGAAAALVGRAPPFFRSRKDGLGVTLGTADADAASSMLGAAGTGWAGGAAATLSAGAVATLGPLGVGSAELVPGAGSVQIRGARKPTIARICPPALIPIARRIFRFSHMTPLLLGEKRTTKRNRQP